MKKRFLCLLLSLLSFACAAPDAIELPPQALPTISAAEETIDALPADAQAPVSLTEAPTEAPSAAPMNVTNEYASYEIETPASPLIKDVTLKELDWANLLAGKQYHTKFYNESVDFQQFRYTVEAFRSDGTGTAFTIHVQFPAAWTDLQCLSMNQYIGFRFYLDGKAQHDFRLTDQSVILSEALSSARCDDFTMTYTSEAITDEVMHGYHEWSIVPFFWHWKVFNGDKWNNKNGRTWIDVTNGDYCEYNGGEMDYTGGEIEITELKELSLKLPIEHTHEPVETPKEPKLLQVSIWREDVERNEKEGHYGSDGRLKDGSYVVYGTWQNVTVDFSELEIYVERFYYWEHGFFYLFHIVYPESWSEEVRRNVRIDIRTYADGEPFGEALDNKGHIRWYITYGGASNWRNVGNPNNNAPYPTEIYRFADSRRFSLINPIEQKELTSKVTLEYHTTIRFDNSNQEIDLTNGEPYYIESIHAYSQEARIPFTEFTIMTDTLTLSQGGAQ